VLLEPERTVVAVARRQGTHLLEISKAVVGELDPRVDPPVGDQRLPQADDRGQRLEPLPMRLDPGDAHPTVDELLFVVPADAQTVLPPANRLEDGRGRRAFPHEIAHEDDQIVCPHREFPQQRIELGVAAVDVPDDEYLLPIRGVDTLVVFCHRL
jgi:hypothetical protein